MKTRIVTKNALRIEGLDLMEGVNDRKPIIIGKIGLTDVNNPITSGSAFLMLEVYLFYKDFNHAN